MKPCKKQHFVLAALAVALLNTPLAEAQADVAVIVNPANKVSKMSANDIKRIYLGKAKTFPQGSSAVAVDLKDSSAKNLFYKKVVKKSPTQLKAYWSKLIFTGKGTPPTVKNRDEDVIKWVAENREAIAYVDASSVNSSVKVIYTVK